MISFKHRRRLPASDGWCWPHNGNATPANIFSNFGPRLFPPYVAKTGFNYDFHRGIDILITEGNPVYASIAGPVTRASRTHFGWETAAQLTYWAETDAFSAATFTRFAPTSLRVSGSRIGAKTWPNVAFFENKIIPIDPTTSDWEARFFVTTDPVVTGGAIGFGVHDPLTDEYFALEYDGATVTTKGKDKNGTSAADGDHATATPTYFHAYYVLATDTLVLEYTDDTTSWTTLSTITTFSTKITNGLRPSFRLMLYWRSKDTNAAVQTVDVDFAGFWDFNTIPKFGNWVQINTLNNKVYQLHLQDIQVEVGAIVESGQQIGLSGITGFDPLSGVNFESHTHLEYTSILADGFFYNDYDGMNPTKPGLLPRTNGSGNVSAAVTSANDPDGNASHLLTVTITRNDQDFDANEFHLVGNTTSRTVNFNTSAGIDPVNWRIPRYDSVYIVADTFDDTSATLVFRFYFKKATVGSSFVSAYVKDVAGNTLWSTP